jgi:copper chaperone CopZ
LTVIDTVHTLRGYRYTLFLRKKPMTTAQLTIEGMHCGGCVSRVTGALKGVPGVTVESVNVGSARVRYDDSSVAPVAIVGALHKLGFDARVDAVPGTVAGS